MRSVYNRNVGYSRLAYAFGNIWIVLGLVFVKTFQFIHSAYHSNESKKIAQFVLLWQFFLEQIESAARIVEFCSERRCHIRRFRQLLLFYHTHLVPTPREGTRRRKVVERRFNSCTGIE